MRPSVPSGEITMLKTLLTKLQRMQLSSIHTKFFHSCNNSFQQFYTLAKIFTAIFVGESLKFRVYSVRHVNLCILSHTGHISVTVYDFD